MRTAPLWGVRMQPMLMHDGASLTFRDAILRHRGEASHITKRFEKLRHADQPCGYHPPLRGASTQKDASQDLPEETHRRCA